MVFRAPQVETYSYMVVIDMGIPINPTRHLTAPRWTYRSRKILTWRWRNTLTRRIRGERGKDRKRRSVLDVSTVQANVQLHGILHLLSWELTYPLSRASWRWFSFSAGGICLFPVGHSFRQRLSYPNPGKKGSKRTLSGKARSQWLVFPLKSNELIPKIAMIGSRVHAKNPRLSIILGPINSLVFGVYTFFTTHFGGWLGFFHIFWIVIQKLG